MLTNIHHLPADGNFCASMETIWNQLWYKATRHVVHVNKSECMTNNYCISRCTWTFQFWTVLFSSHLV